MRHPGVRVATSNMLKLLSAEQSERLVDRVVAAADVIVWQEVTRTHRRTLRRLAERGWATFAPSEELGGLAISWRTARFRLVSSRARAVVQGTAGDPRRGYAEVVLEDLEDGTLWPILDTHMSHQAWTTHPERRPRWWAQAYRLRMRTRRLALRYDRAIGGGDVNRHQWAPKGTVGTWSPNGSHGRARYDVLWRRGRVEQRGQTYEIRTPSDHDTVVATFAAT